MTIEIYKSSTRAGNVNHTAYFDDEMFELSTFFSGSVNFNIVDSYSSISGRYIGDPIADNKWNSAADINANNSWFVIECITTYHSWLPNWQCKIQCTQSSGFADVSDPTGVAYPLNHGSTNITCFRFAPVGGWDYATSTPDFNPSGVSVTGVTTKNHAMYVGPHASFGGTGAECRWFLIADTGGFTRFNKLMASPYYLIGCGGYIGDIVPVDDTLQRYPRIFLGSGDNDNFQLFDNGAGYMLCEGANTSGATWTSADSTAGIAYYNENDILIEEAFTLPDYTNLLGALPNNPNTLGSTIGIDVAPYTPMPLSVGSIGVIPIIGRGKGFGPVMVDSGNWISTSDYDDCAYFKWDGSTQIY
jgi:hypothetical protein